MGLTFAGLVALNDPIKADAREALGELACPGIALKLITGDHRLVAARAAGARPGLDLGDCCDRGGPARHERRRVGELRAADRRYSPRSSRTRRSASSSRCARRAIAVGFLGDGINDAAALHAADVGISVESAADVTRQAADIVLLEKEPRRVGRGVREGRQAFGNTLKYIFITTAPTSATCSAWRRRRCYAAFLPLLPAQILLINVLTDLPAMAIATDGSTRELARRPRRWEQSRHRAVHGRLRARELGLRLLTFGDTAHRHVSPAVFRTGWFIESVLSELLVLLVIRTRRAFFRSLPGAGLVVSSVAVATATLLLPWSPLAAPMGLTPLPLDVALLMAGIVILYVAASEGTKRLVFRSATL